MAATKKVSLRPFTGSDWDAFSGAERWPCGASPSAAWAVWGEHDYLQVICSPGAIEVYFDSRDDGDDECYVVSVSLNRELTENIAEMIFNQLTVAPSLGIAKQLAKWTGMVKQ